MFTEKSLKEQKDYDACKKDYEAYKEKNFREQAYEFSQKSAILFSIYYKELKNCGFTEDEAMEIIKATIIAKETK